MSAPGDESTHSLLVVGDSLSGGLGDAVTHHASWFAAHGWDVTVAAHVDDGATDLAIEHRDVPMPATVRDVAGLARAARTLRNLRHGLKPDIVHCHGARSFVVARASGVRPFVTLHSLASGESEPAGYRFVRRPGLGLVALMAREAFSVLPQHPPGWRFLPHASARLADLSLFGPPSGPNPTILWVGRLEEPKQPELFVEAVAGAARLRPEIRGVMAGSGPLAGPVAERIAALGAPVELVGHVPDVAPLLEAASAVVLFSRSEGVPFALEEALWSGRTVVASPLPGIRWLLGNNGQGGRVVGDTDAAIGALVELCDSGTARQRGAAAAAHIRTLLGPEDPWPAVEKAYVSAMSSTRR